MPFSVLYCGILLFELKKKHIDFYKRYMTVIDFFFKSTNLVILVQFSVRNLRAI